MRPAFVRSLCGVSLTDCCVASHRWIVEQRQTQVTEAGSAPCEGHASCGGAPLGLIGWAGLHHQHPRTLCRGMSPRLLLQ